VGESADNGEAVIPTVQGGEQNGAKVSLLLRFLVVGDTEARRVTTIVVWRLWARMSSGHLVTDGVLAPMVQSERMRSCAYLLGIDLRRHLRLSERRWVEEFPLGFRCLYRGQPRRSAPGGQETLPSLQVCVLLARQILNRCRGRM
jgi:hypothetical protein